MVNCPASSSAANLPRSHRRNGSIALSRLCSESIVDTLSHIRWRHFDYVKHRNNVAGRCSKTLSQFDFTVQF